MSAYTTLRITRTRAKAYVLDRLMRMDDSGLEAMLDVALEERLYRAQIVSDDDEYNDDGHL